MKVLIIGSGGREHAIADAFGRAADTEKIYVSPGNAGIAQEYSCVKLDTHSQIRDFCKSEEIDLVFIGPEQPICEGLSDYLREEGIWVFAPSQKAARLESSKAFAKYIMSKYDVPTARYSLVKSMEEMGTKIEEYGLPVVLKADGLAAGKGVIIANNYEEAQAAAAELFATSAGATGILVEEYLKGWEVSLFAITDGTDYVTTLFAQDHKQLYDGDTGPNTGGMGAHAPVKSAEEYRMAIERDILKPVLKAMREEKCPYTGILYMGLMITESGAKVIEFNCRLGDPETQALLPLLKSDITEICRRVRDRKIAGMKLKWEAAVCIAVVLAAEGYPGQYLKGIELNKLRAESQVFYAGVASKNTKLISSGGRVLSLVAKGENIQEARKKVYTDLEKLSEPRLIYRKDIGLRENIL